MLRLFRHIRQRLFLEGRVSRYFGYAVGEIVLIVVGIMIALEANEWKEERREAKLEASYLNRLRANIEDDIQLWSAHYPRLENKEAALSEILDWLNNPEFEEVRLRELATQITLGSQLAYSMTSQSNRTTFDELVSTGQLNIISNSELRENLQYYYIKVDTQQTRIEGRETKYAQRAYELVPRDPEFSVMQGLEYEDFKDIGERALTTDLKSLIIGERNRSRLFRQIFSALLEQSNELLSQVEGEIAETELSN